MNLIELQDKIKLITESDNFQADFIFKLLEAYSFPKTTILKLKKEDRLNILKLKNKLYFKETTIEEDEHVVIDDLSKNKDVLKLNPRFIVVTDYENFIAIDTRKNIEDASRTLDLKIKDLYRRYDFFAPWIGIESYQVDKEAIADIKAANKMSKLYDQILADNPNFYKAGSPDLNLLLSRLLFCFFAEDTGIFEKNIFTNSILSNSNVDGDNLSDYISRVFDVFNIEVSKRNKTQEDLNLFPYVNGGLFKDKIILPKFTRKSRAIIEECGLLDWSEINPDIFGSMIQAVVHPDERESLGMHYTSVPNILKLIRPLFLDDLYEDYFKYLNNKKELENLRARISKIKVFDPACGSGNFLIIAYKELCKLESLILKQLYGNDKKLDLEFEHSYSSVTLNNFYGIEIDGFAHEVAKLSLYLAQHQVNVMFKNEFGKLKPILPLRESGKIVCANSARKDWEDVCSNDGEIYIVGNPPYLGSRNQDLEQKLDMESVLKTEYKSLDYISIWFIKGSDYVSKNENCKLAFVSTNSICQGEQVSLLWPRIFSKNIEISFAYQSFKWENNAKHNAGVSVIMVGLSKVSITKNKKIFIEDKVIWSKNINPYLIDASNIIVESRTTQISGLPEMYKGNLPNDGGGLLFTYNEYLTVINNYPQSKELFRKLTGSYEFINSINRFCLWISPANLNLALSIPEIVKRFEIVKKHRLSSPDEGAHKLAKRYYQFRDLRETKKQSLIIPSVSSELRAYIPIGFIDNKTISTNSALIIFDCEVFLFGIISSRMHMVWVRVIGGRHEDRLRYSKNVIYNTFPFPKIIDSQKELICKQVYNILDEREKYPGKTLAELYDPNKMPYELKLAHQYLDEVIDKIYRQKPFENDEERLTHLFKLYEEMIEKEKGVKLIEEVKPKKRKK